MTDARSLQIPRPESQARSSCRVEGCTAPVVGLAKLDCVASVGFIVGDHLHIVTDEHCQRLWNHGFCAAHLEQIPRVFVRRWAEAKHQVALERLWQMIADDLTFEAMKK